MQHTKLNLARREQIKSARRKFTVFAVPGCELLTHTRAGQTQQPVILLVKWVINTKASRGAADAITPRRPENSHVQILFLQQAASVFVCADL
jgi:hypothetical protein